MAILFYQLKKLNLKKTLIVVLVAGMTAGILSSPFAGATGPQFNIFPIAYTPTLNHDMALIDAKNVTQGIGYSTSQADHDNGVSATSGDIIEFSVYYHNGMPNTPENTAIGTIIRAMVQPVGGTSATTHMVGGSISASNATTVNSIDHGGDMKVAISGGQPLSLSYVPGSTVLYKERGSTNPPSAQTMPDGIFSGGVNIGDVQGCFEFHGYVNFRLRVSSPVAVGSLTVKKYVRNVTTGSGFEDVQVTAQPGQTVEFKVVTTATNGNVDNVTVKDSALDSRLSTPFSVSLDGTPTTASVFFSSTGISLGNLTAGTSRTVLFQSTVGASSLFTPGIPNNLVDTASAWSASQTVQDDAIVTVNVATQQVVCTFIYDAPFTSDGTNRGSRRVGDLANVREQVTGLGANSSFNIKNVHVTGSPTLRSPLSADSQGGYLLAKDTTTISSAYVVGDYNSYIEVGNQNVATCLGFRVEPNTVQQINLTKNVRNENTGGNFAETATALPGQRVTYQIIVSPQNSNTTLQNVLVRDVLPNKMSYVSGSLNVNGSSGDSNAFFGAGLTIGQVLPSQQVTITFQADIASTSNFSAGVCESIVNNGYVTASGGLSATDSAVVSVCKDSITKQPGSPGSRPIVN